MKNKSKSEFYFIQNFQSFFTLKIEYSRDFWFFSSRKRTEEK